MQFVISNVNGLRFVSNTALLIGSWFITNWNIFKRFSVQRFICTESRIDLVNRFNVFVENIRLQRFTNRYSISQNGKDFSHYYIAKVILSCVTLSSFRTTFMTSSLSSVVFDNGCGSANRFIQISLSTFKKKKKKWRSLTFTP